MVVSRVANILATAVCAGGTILTLQTGNNGMGLFLAGVTSLSLAITIGRYNA